jgi:NAD+ synthase (glutamine-hydrolysing)
VRIALAQINPVIGDIEGNVTRCLVSVKIGQREGADLVLLPEMAISGCHPRDILYDPSFTDAVWEATVDLAILAKDAPPIVVGTITKSDQATAHHPGLYNTAVLLKNGKVKVVAAKRLLRSDDVYHEGRWFVTGSSSLPVEVAGKRIGVLFDSDLQDEGHPIYPAADLKAAGAQILLCLSASPFSRDAMMRRLETARRPKCPIIYANLSGANDELIFDGNSFALDQKGGLIALLPGFEEEVRLVDFEEPKLVKKLEENSEKTLFDALVLGVRDFSRKNRINKIFLGLSGGVDSSVTAVIAAKALGSKRVTGVAIPSRYTDPRSTASAKTLAQNLDIHFEVVEMEKLHAAAEDVMGMLLGEGTVAENVQARLRAMILMGFVNRYGGMLLNTSNKTELTLGYSTIYGDMAGTLGPIADLTKPEVIALAEWINAESNVIPGFVLERAPTAELRPGQVDPFDYSKISPELELLVQENRSNRVMLQSEHKRWQMGIVLKVSEKAFGSGRLIPITRQ